MPFVEIDRPANIMEFTVAMVKPTRSQTDRQTEEISLEKILLTICQKKFNASERFFFLKVVRGFSNEVFIVIDITSAKLKAN